MYRVELARYPWEPIHSDTVLRKKLFRTEKVPSAHAASAVDWTRYPDAPSVRTPFDFSWVSLSPGGALEPHRHPSGEIYVFYQGEGLMHVEEETEMVRPGDAVYIPPDELHTVTNNTDQDLIWLCLMYEPTAHPA